MQGMEHGDVWVPHAPPNNAKNGRQDSWFLFSPLP